MKNTLDVDLNALKHEFDKDGYPVTTLHLELPSGADTKFLKRAHRITKNQKSREVAKFSLRIIDERGKKRTWRLTSKGTKTKEYVFVAVGELAFNAHDRFEEFLNPVDREVLTIQLEVEIEEPQNTLFTPPDSNDDRDGRGVSA
ncbi:hypothetical protein [Deinococcus altitudinis]|uniref:hypothetical protein n=1 Tax=Deinococcus altitudinis TaxID=468914 RepID=UPI0038911ACA